MGVELTGIHVESNNSSAPVHALLNSADGDASAQPPHSQRPHQLHKTESIHRPGFVPLADVEPVQSRGIPLLWRGLPRPQFSDLENHVGSKLANELLHSDSGKSMVQLGNGQFVFLSQTEEDKLVLGQILPAEMHTSKLLLKDAIDFAQLLLGASYLRHLSLGSVVFGKSLVDSAIFTLAGEQVVVASVDNRAAQMAFEFEQAQLVLEAFGFNVIGTDGTMPRASLGDTGDMILTLRGDLIELQCLKPAGWKYFEREGQFRAIDTFRLQDKPPSTELLWALQKIKGIVFMSLDGQVVTLQQSSWQYGAIQNKTLHLFQRAYLAYVQAHYIEPEMIDLFATLRASVLELVSNQIRNLPDVEIRLPNRDGVNADDEAVVTNPFVIKGVSPASAFLALVRLQQVLACIPGGSIAAAQSRELALRIRQNIDAGFYAPADLVKFSPSP